MVTFIKIVKMLLTLIALMIQLWFHYYLIVIFLLWIALILSSIEIIIIQKKLLSNSQKTPKYRSKDVDYNL
jgi:hypothetical protein